MRVFVDTNVLLRSVRPSHPMHGPAVRSLVALIRASEPVVITPQNPRRSLERVHAPGRAQWTRLVPPANANEVVKIEGFCADRVGGCIQRMETPRGGVSCQAFKHTMHTVA